MIKDAFIQYHAAKGLNGGVLLARLQDKAKEQDDPEAWRALIAWSYQQCIFTQPEIAAMLGLSISSLRRRFNRYGQ